MKIGVCTWIFGDVRLDRVFHAVAQSGADGIELLGDLRPIEAAGIRRLLAAEGLSVFSLTPIDVDRHGQEVDLAHPDKAVRQRSIDVYQEMLDLAANVGAPIVGCHGRVGRVHALTTLAEEETLLTDSVCQIAERAASFNVHVAFEVLNRYETHLIHDVEAAHRLLSAAAVPGLGLLLDTYHMNIEEPDLIQAVENISDRMILLHVADSNRRAPGQGHVPFPRLLGAIRRIGYSEPWIVECTTPGENPFAVDPGAFHRVVEEVTASISYLRVLEEA